MTLLCFSLVSASYNFDYEKPSLDGFGNQAFSMSKIFGTMNQYVRIVYNLLTTARFYESQLYRCEAELKTRPIRHRSSGGSGGGSSPQTQAVPQEIVIEYSLCDLNKDGVEDIKDLGEWANCQGDYGNESDSVCDINEDGMFDLLDLGEWANCQ